MNHLALATLAAAVCWSAVTCAQHPDETNVPTRAKRETLRRGAMVEHIDGTQHDTLENEIRQALDLPADDSAKWHLTLVIQDGCQPCEILRADIEKHPALAPWIDVASHKKSWFSYQLVRIDDPSQAWRWQHRKPTRFPTLIIQTPNDESMGPKGAVVDWIEGYHEKPHELADRFRASITAWVAKMRSFRQQNESPQTRDPNQTGQGDWTPPVTPLPPLAPPSVNPSPISPLPALPSPAPAPFPAQTPMTWWMMLILTLSNAFMAWLEWRKNQPR